MSSLADGFGGVAAYVRGALFVGLCFSCGVACSDDDGRPGGPAPIDPQGGSSFGGSGLGGSNTAGNSNSGATGGTTSGGAGGNGGSGGLSPSVVFDPEQVYVMGRLASLDCNTWVVAGIEKVGEYEGGLPCNTDQPQVRPSDGALVYRFDAQKYYLWETDHIASGYPPLPHTNDLPLAVPSGCTANRIWFTPDTAEAFFNCVDGRVLSSKGAWNLGDEEPVALGYAGLHLTKEGSQLFLRQGNNRTPVEFGSISFNVNNLLNARATEGGFYIQAKWAGGSLGAAIYIAASGEAIQVGNYPGLPPSSGAFSSCALEQDGVSVCVFEYGNYWAIGRLTPGAASVELLYTEEEGSAFKLEQAQLFTGP